MATQERSNLQELSRFLDNSSSTHGGPPTHLRQSNPYVVNRHGNYHSHCRGRIALGPGGPTYFLAIPSFAIILTIMILQNKLVIEMLGSSVTITGYVAISIGFVSFFIASTSDPGVVPKDYSYYQLMEETHYRRMTFPGERYYRYCNKCSCIRPPRSYHCKICNICIRRHDVHSYLIGTCVGERNFRSFLCLHFSLSFLSVFLLAVHTKLLINLTMLTRLSVIPIPIFNLALSAISLMYGVILLTFPNLGVFLLIYRIYLICVNRTFREDYRIFSDKNIDNPPYIKSLRKNIFEFLMPKFPCRSSLHSSHNRIATGSPDLVSESLRMYAGCHHGNRGVFCASLVNSSDFIIDLEDGFTYGPASYHSQADDKIMRDKVIIDNLTATARKNCGSSLPQIVNGGLLSIPGFEVRNIKVARPSEILVRKIKNFHNNRALSKAEISYRKHHNDKTTLSDSCIPRTENTQVELVTMARAAQIQAIIERVINRDRKGLIDLSRRINISALVGIENFDPDDLQVIELNNGIPLVTRRNHNHLHQHGRNVGGAQHSSPQMVAAGFLPPAQTFLSAASRVVRRPLATGIPQNNVVNNNNIHCVTNTRMETNRQRRRRLLLNSCNQNNNNNTSRGFERYFGNALTRHEQFDPEDDIVDNYVNRSDSLRRQALRNVHNLQTRDSDDVIRVITTPPDSNGNLENLNRSANSSSPTSADIILGGLRQLRRNAREHILSFTNRRPVANPTEDNQRNENSDELNETQRNHFVLMAERLSGLSRTLSQRREYLLQLQRQLNSIDDENNEYHDQLEE